MLTSRNAHRACMYSTVVAISTYFGSIALAMDKGTDLMDIDPRNFSRPTTIDNKWFPLRPGIQLIYEGTTVDDDGKPVPHRLIYTVTDLVKKINGIDVVVVWDRDFSEGKLEESELTFFAQDDAGNVWHLGQYVETYDELRLVGGHAWLVGHLPGAKAGIMMPADPKVGTPSYSQGFAPAPFNWTDRAQIRKFGESVAVPAGTYENVMVVEEWAREEGMDGLQLKYHAQGVGTVKVGFEGEDAKKEKLELVKIVEFTPQEMDEARAEAMKLDDRNYVYGRTEPVRRRER
jgi:hypothetical protein